MESTTTTATAYKVSEQTANYINCLKQCSELYSSISTALEAQYGNTSGTADAMLEADILPIIDQLKGKVHYYLQQSMEDNLAIIENNGKIL